MKNKSLRLPPIDNRVAEIPPRTVLIKGFGVYPMSDAEKAAGAKQVTKETYALLRDGTAAVAWVTSREEGWDSGYEAGPWYKVEYAFEDADGNLRKGKCGGAFDGMHLAYGGNEWTDFLAGVCAGKIDAFTVLYEEAKSTPVAHLFSK